MDEFDETVKDAFGRSVRVLGRQLIVQGEDGRCIMTPHPDFLRKAGEILLRAARSAEASQAKADAGEEDEAPTMDDDWLRARLEQAKFDLAAWPDWKRREVFRALMQHTAPKYRDKPADDDEFEQADRLGRCEITMRDLAKAVAELREIVLAKPERRRIDRARIIAAVHKRCIPGPGLEHHAAVIIQGAVVAAVNALCDQIDEILEG